VPDSLPISGKDSRDEKASLWFSNYLLDQTVIHDVYENTHETVRNRTAERLVQADPKRFEVVDYPDYWKGWDF